MKKLLLFGTLANLLILENHYCYAQSIGINGNGANPDATALLDIDATGMSPLKGLLLPRLTTTERDAITSPVTSLMIFNSTTNCYEGYNSSTSTWLAFGCIGCQLPGAFSASAASSIAGTIFSANWAASAGATGYYLDVSTVNTFASFVSGYSNLNVGNVLASGVTGLTIGNTYYYRVRANNSCGSSANSNIITVTTIACPASIAISHTIGTLAPETKSVTYGIVTSSLSGSSKCWITRNFGATNQASSATDATAASAGWFWQFNRKQGYKIGPTPAWTISAIDEDSGWLPVNDPCTIEFGTGWRIPTQTEWTNADANGVSGGWDNYTETYNDVLKLHAAGWLGTISGTLSDSGVRGYLWSSSQNGTFTTQAMYLGFLNTGSSVGNNTKAVGYSLRCLRD